MNTKVKKVYKIARIDPRGEVDILPYEYETEEEAFKEEDEGYAARPFFTVRVHVIVNTV